MTNQEKTFAANQEKALKRMNEKLSNGRTMPCEYHGCSCLIKTQISALTMSVIVTPKLDVEFVCKRAALEFAAKQGVAHKLM